MPDLEQKDKGHVSRRQAAELLTDIAFALTTGGPLELTIDGRRVIVPVSEELELERDLKSKGDRFELELELHWSAH
jgi:amphi-Trp domain-containing protein